MEMRAEFEIWVCIISLQLSQGFVAQFFAVGTEKGDGNRFRNEAIDCGFQKTEFEKQPVSDVP